MIFSSLLVRDFKDTGGLLSTPKKTKAITHLKCCQKNSGRIKENQHDYHYLFGSSLEKGKILFYVHMLKLISVLVFAQSLGNMQSLEKKNKKKQT